MKENLLLKYLKPGSAIAVETSMGRTLGTFVRVEDGYLVLSETTGDRPSALIRLGSVRGIEFHSEDAKGMPGLKPKRGR